MAYTGLGVESDGGPVMPVIDANHTDQHSEHDLLGANDSDHDFIQKNNSVDITNQESRAIHW